MYHIPKNYRADLRSFFFLERREHSVRFCLKRREILLKFAGINSEKKVSCRTNTTRENDKLFQNLSNFAVRILHFQIITTPLVLAKFIFSLDSLDSLDSTVQLQSITPEYQGGINALPRSGRCTSPEDPRAHTDPGTRPQEIKHPSAKKKAKFDLFWISVFVVDFLFYVLRVLLPSGFPLFMLYFLRFFCPVKRYLSTGE